MTATQSARRWRHLDLYSCEGGVARGIDNAGADVYVLDRFKMTPDGYSRKNNPYPACTMDAIEALDWLLAGSFLTFTQLDGTEERFGWADFDSIGGSPPCPHASAGTRAHRAAGKQYPRLIEPTRRRFIELGLPYVIENVSGAALNDPITLCGSMFNLTAPDADGEMLHLERHRGFETNWPLQQPPHPCWPAGTTIAGLYGGGRRAKVPKGTPYAVSAPLDRYAAKHVRKGGYVPRSKDVKQQLMGIDWMTVGAMDEAIPPVYAEWVGLQLRAHLMLAPAA